MEVVSLEHSRFRAEEREGSSLPLPGYSHQAVTSQCRTTPRLHIHRQAAAAGVRNCMGACAHLKFGHFATSCAGSEQQPLTTCPLLQPKSHTNAKARRAFRARVEFCSGRPHPTSKDPGDMCLHFLAAVMKEQGCGARPCSQGVHGLTGNTQLHLRWKAGLGHAGHGLHQPQPWGEGGMREWAEMQAAEMQEYNQVPESPMSSKTCLRMKLRPSHWSYGTCFHLLRSGPGAQAQAAHLAL